MPTIQRMEHCYNCGRKTLHVQQRESNLFHLILSIVTVGAWLIVWVFARARASSPQCTVCGETIWSNAWKNFDLRRKAPWVRDTDQSGTVRRAGGMIRGKVFGGIAGLALSGPVGLIVGALLGHNLDIWLRARRDRVRDHETSAENRSLRA